MIQVLTPTDLRAMVSKPELLKLQQIAKGLTVGRVLHNNVLIDVISPSTKLDEIEKSGLLVFTQETKKDHTPMSCFGIVLQVGPGVPRYDEATGDGIEPGMVVFFSKHAGVTATFDGMVKAKDGKDVKQDRVLKLLQFGEIFCTLEAVDGDVDDKIGTTIPASAPVDIPIANGRAVVS